MRFLIDMNLSPGWVPFLQRAGFVAVHWSAIGKYDASDRELMRWAEDNGYIVVTNDLDFSAILAATQRQQPSVMQIRADLLTPAVIGGAVLRAIEQTRDELAAGALVSVDIQRARLRVLPINANCVGYSQRMPIAGNPAQLRSYHSPSANTICFPGKPPLLNQIMPASGNPSLSPPQGDLALLVSPRAANIQAPTEESAEAGQLIRQSAFRIEKKTGPWPSRKGNWKEPPWLTIRPSRGYPVGPHSPQETWVQCRTSV
jgi:predicted nuclease of predicted toxin-antitoxin system